LFTAPAVLSRKRTSKWCGKLSPVRPSCASKSKSVPFPFKMVSMALSQRNLSEPR